MLAGILLIVMPAMTFAINLMLNLPHADVIATSCFVSGNLYSALNGFIVLYFIVPYRRAVRKVFGKFVHHSSVQ